MLPCLRLLPPAPRVAVCVRSDGEVGGMGAVQGFVVAVMQGATELFPVSSLGHAVILPGLLHWQVDARTFLPFLVMLHLGTAAALLGYFYQDWWQLALGALGRLDEQRSRESRHIWVLLAVATVPAGILGLGLGHRLRDLFGVPLYAALLLVANGVLLLVGERLRGTAREGAGDTVAGLSYIDALVIGIWQSLALLPGISRSGATIVGGLLRGIDHATSAHFSFLIATPIILLAAGREVPKLLHAGLPVGTFEMAAAAAVVAGIVAYASTAFLMRYFRDHDDWALNPFAYYCFVVGAGSAAWLVLA